MILFKDIAVGSSPVRTAKAIPPGWLFCAFDSHPCPFGSGLFGLSSYLVWVGVKFSNAKEEELLINDASQIGSKKFDFSIE